MKGERNTRKGVESPDRGRELPGRGRGTQKGRKLLGRHRFELDGAKDGGKKEGGQRFWCGGMKFHCVNYQRMWGFVGGVKGGGSWDVDEWGLVRGVRRRTSWDREGGEDRMFVGGEGG